MLAFFFSDALLALLIFSVSKTCVLSPVACMLMWNETNWGLIQEQVKGVGQPTTQIQQNHVSHWVLVCSERGFHHRRTWGLSCDPWRGVSTGDYLGNDNNKQTRINIGNCHCLFFILTWCQTPFMCFFISSF